MEFKTMTCIVLSGTGNHLACPYLTVIAGLFLILVCGGGAGVCLRRFRNTLAFAAKCLRAGAGITAARALWLISLAVAAWLIRR